MKITKSKLNKPLYDGNARITQHGTGVLLSENRSTGADNRISAVSVLLSREELIRACTVAGIDVQSSGVGEKLVRDFTNGGSGGGGSLFGYVNKSDLDDLNKKSFFDSVKQWLSKL